MTQVVAPQPRVGVAFQLRLQEQGQAQHPELPGRLRRPAPHEIWVGLGLAPGWNALQAGENDLNRLGFWVGAGAQTPQDGGIETVHEADIATAEHLGARVTAQAAALTVGRATLAEVTA